MADSRIRNLTDEVLAAHLSALLNTLYLAVDDTTFTDAKKVLLKTLLTEAVIDANTNNYQAMSPKSFYDSVMTNARKGIGMISPDADVTSKSGSNLLTSIHQTLMQAQWLIDWCIAGSALVYDPLTMKDTNIGASVGAVNMRGVYQGTMGLVESCFFYPRGGMYGLSYALIYAQLAIKADGVVYAGTISLTKSTSEVSVNLGTTGCIAALAANGVNFRIYSPLAKSSVKLSISIQAILE
jgi:hypothetical protein